MRPWTPWRLSLGLGWLLLWTALVVVLHLAFAGSQPRRGALPMKAVLHTQDAKAAACQPACLVLFDKSTPPSERALRAETSHAATSAIRPRRVSDVTRGGSQGQV